MLIAENAKWDAEDKMEAVLDDYLALLRDEKPIPIRQCIQSLSKIAACKPGLSDKIAAALMTVDIRSIKETMQKLILTDVLNTLFIIRKERKTDAIENYILNALSGGVLDKKLKTQFEALL